MLITIDFETFYSTEHSLTRMSTSAYIRSPEFETLMCAVKINDEPTAVHIGHNDIAEALAEIDWSEAEVLCHNAMFDGFILAQVFGFCPAKYRDTLSMVRAQFPYWTHHNLDTCGANLDLGRKMSGVLSKLKGLHLADIPLEQLLQAANYCKRDAELCHDIYKKLEPGFPDSELELIHMTIRLFCQPKLEVDVKRASDLLRSEILAKDEAVAQAGTNRSVLMSNPEFAKELVKLGVTPPRKISPTTDLETWAFAKSDSEFQKLFDHEDPRVRSLCKARIKVKSTINETRAARFIAEGAHNTLPVGLRYYAAHTGRWGGANKLNLQNLQRGGELRKSIKAPPGYVLVVADLTQIECRMNAWLANEQALLSTFRNGQDVYSEFATKFYGTAISKSTHPLERFVGKTCVLGLGYQMGAPKLQFSLQNARPSVELSLDVCEGLVRTYRSVYPAIRDQWRAMDGIIARMAMGATGTYGPLEYGRWHIRLPNGMALQYWKLTADYENDWLTQSSYSLGREHKIGLYGGKLTENVVQALARIVMSDAMLRIDRELPVVMHVHDEIAVLAPESQAQETLDFMIAEMTKAPSWCPTIPLAAEGGYDQIYSK